MDELGHGHARAVEHLLDGLLLLLHRLIFFLPRFLRSDLLNFSSSNILDLEMYFLSLFGIQRVFYFDEAF